MFVPILFAVTLALSVSSHVQPVRRRYFNDWAQPQDHPVNTLFKRGEEEYPAVGSQEWSSKYPGAGSTPDRGQTPKAWFDALQAAVSSGKIPDIPQTNIGGDGDSHYPEGVNPGSPEICSTAAKCRGSDPSLIYDGPDGTWGLNFDDGPTPATSGLVDFLKNNKETATHFMIGGNILSNPDSFRQIIDYGGDCAVHTWSHPKMTSSSNEDILAELGWTMQIIHDSTGGKVPRMWRPPTGDSDTRVRAIAKEVFGLTTVIWNQDTDDWKISENGQSLEGVAKDFDEWVQAPKSPGMNVLEHELNDDTVKAFVENYPKVKSNGWKIGSLAQLLDKDGAYQKTSKIFNVGSNSSSSSSSSSSAAKTATKSTSSGKPSETGTPSSDRQRAPNSSISLLKRTDLILLLPFMVLLSYISDIQYI